jgi:hypothetical protein
MQSKNKNKPGKVDGTPKTVGGTPKTVGGTPKTVCRSSQKVGGTPKKVCGASKKVGGTPKTVGGASKTVGGTPKTVGGASKTVGGTPKTVGGASKTVGGTPKTVGGTQSNVTQSDFEIGSMYCVTIKENNNKQVSGFCENKFNDRLILKTSSNKKPTNLSIEYDNISCEKLIANASIKYINEHFKNDLTDGLLEYTSKNGCCYKNITLFSFVKEYNDNENNEFKNKVDEAFPGYNKRGNSPTIQTCISKLFRLGNPCDDKEKIELLLNYIRTTYDDKFNNAASNKIIFQKLMPLHNYLLLDNSK